jgi:hypothetical protein
VFGARKFVGGRVSSCPASSKSAYCPALSICTALGRNVCPPFVDFWKSRCGSKESLQFSETNPTSRVPLLSTTGSLN